MDARVHQLHELAYVRALPDVARQERLFRVRLIEPFDDRHALGQDIAVVQHEGWYRALRIERRQRAHVRELVQLVNAGIHPLQNTRVRKAIAADDAARQRWAAHHIERGLRAYEAHVRKLGGRFSVGDDLTMADLFVVPQAQNAARFGADIRDCQRVQEIYAACLALPEAWATRPEQAAREAAAVRGG